MAKKKKKKEKKYCKKVKNNGERCKRTAVPGYDFCINHGGPNFNSPKWRKNWQKKVKHGKTSKYIQAGPQVMKLIDEVKRSDDYKNIDENLAVMTAILTAALKQTEKEKGLRGVVKDAKEFFWMLERIQKGILTKAKIEEGLNYKIDIEVIGVVLQQIMAILEQRIKDPILLRDIAEDFSKLKIRDMPMKGRKSRNEMLGELERESHKIKELTGVVAEAKLLGERNG